MPLYEYKCPHCGIFEQQHPMASVPKTVVCTQCSSKARKLISAIGLSQINSTRAKLIDSTNASAHEPQVVTSRPGTVKPARVTHNPLHAKLPRP